MADTIHPGTPIRTPSVQPSQEGEPFDANALLARVWQQNAHIMRGRRDCLVAAAAAAMSGALTPEMRTEARDIAHKMAGSLGMFGYQDGTVAAQKMELLLDVPGEPDAHELVRLAEALRAAMPV